jgi:hypothetical protein
MNLENFIESHPIRNEGCERNQFELSFEWDSIDHGNDDLIVYYRGGSPIGWYSISKCVGHRPY